jgi:DNA-binding MarR family transcriptional regulator
MSSGAVTALVDRLEGAGYVERRPNPRDRRSSVVFIRPEGLETAARHMRPLAAELVEATAGLGEEERSVVGSYLESVTGILARHARG